MKFAIIIQNLLGLRLYDGVRLLFSYSGLWWLVQFRTSLPKDREPRDLRLIQMHNRRKRDLEFLKEDMRQGWSEIRSV